MSWDLRRLLISSVQRPARYVGGEPGQVRKDPDSVRVRFGLCFPDAYEIGMSHLGLRVLYARLNADGRIWCERAFAPLPDMERVMRRGALPLTTLESGTPLRDLDVLGFSLQHELCFTNLLLMLDLGGVPRWVEERHLSDPLVVAGGPTATHPEPLAPFLDAVALGDGETLAAEVALAWVDARDRSETREEALAELARHPSVYVPTHARVERDPGSRRLVVTGGVGGEPPPLAEAARVEDLEGFPFPQGGPVPITEAVFDRAAVEVARGCSGGCRFCQAGMVYRPMRERTVSSVLECLSGQVAEGGFDEASLASLSTADYSQVEALVGGAAESLAGSDVALSVSSLRAYGLSEPLVEALARVRTSSLTLAPEAATQRLRDVINKNVSEEDILRGATAAMTRTRRRLKLYFMIGLPTETAEDVRAIAELALRLREALRTRRGGGRAGVTLSVSTFVPKPHTPLQWAEAIGPEEVRQRQDLLRGLLAGTRVELRPHDVRLSMLEALLSRADRSAARLVEAAYLEGARFDGWDDLFDEDAWRRALDAWGGDAAAERAAIPLGARLPWDHLAVGPSPAYLAREHRRALSGRTTPPCLRPPPGSSDGELHCNHCGLDCDLDRQRAQLDRCRASVRASAPLPQARTSETSRARFGFEKRGDLVLLGHLDTMRLLSRLFRRAGVKVAYSRGYHPKPRLRVAAPLPVGVAGLAEVGDVELEGSPDLEALLETLRRLAPAGLVPTSLRRLAEDEPAATRALAAADLLVASAALPDDVEARAAGLLARSEIVVDRPRKGPAELRGALVDLGPCRDTELLAGLSVVEPAILARVRLGRGPSIRPAEILGLLGADDPAPICYRLGLLAEPLPTPLR